MRHILHPPNPPIALALAIGRGKTDWESFDGKAEVAESLERLQKCLCAYCQIRLDSGIGSHVEHIWPKGHGKHPDKALSWPNLVLSCTHSDVIGKLDGGVSCGHSPSKRNWPRFDPQFVSPTDAYCEALFEYRASDGSVRPAPGLDDFERQRANYTIDLLNLNCSRLCRLRKDMLEQGYAILNEFKADRQCLEIFLASEFGEAGGKLRDFITARYQHFGVFA